VAGTGLIEAKRSQCLLAKRGHSTHINANEAGKTPLAADPLGRVHGLDRVLDGLFRTAGVILACHSTLRTKSLKASLASLRVVRCRPFFVFSRWAGTELGLARRSRRLGSRTRVEQPPLFTITIAISSSITYNGNNCDWCSVRIVLSMMVTIIDQITSIQQPPAPICRYCLFSLSL
jgi:hypothetical protein